jgi:hypothetical protein
MNLIGRAPQAFRLGRVPAAVPGDRLGLDRFAATRRDPPRATPPKARDGQQVPQKVYETVMNEV